MREHKYQGWEKNLKEIIPVHDIDFDKKMININSAWRRFDEVELLEYTGLKDRIVRKDGSPSKKIYRCDIIKALNRNYDCEDNKEDYFQLFEVTYLNGCYMFGNWNAHEFFNKFIYIEDLGSKFEHPEFLEN